MALGIIPALLSHARRTLTKVLRLDTDYTTARAVKIDTIDSKVDIVDTNVDTINSNVDTTVSSRLADSNAVARVQTGLTNQGYTTVRAGYIDNIETVNFRNRVSEGMNNNGFTTTVSGRIDTTISSRLADSNAVARVQSGLDANGYTTTVSARLDTNISNRMAKHTTRAQVSVFAGGIATIVSVGGHGYLHGIDMSGNKGCRVFCDGILVASPAIPASGVGVVSGSGVTHDAAFNQGGASSMNWEFKTSLVVDIVGAGGGTLYTVAYSLE